MILNDPRVHGVALTGSEEAGGVVASQAAKALKKSTLELGGSDAFVVLADADVDKAVKWAVFGRHWNAGQVCVSSKRIIVADEIYDEFMEKYTKGVAALKAGDPMPTHKNSAPVVTPWLIICSSAPSSPRWLRANMPRVTKPICPTLE